MLKILAYLPEMANFRQIQSKGDRYQWEDRATDRLRILAPIPNPWSQEWEVLLLLEQGKTRSGATYPKRLKLLCFPPSEETLVRAKLVRERWKGGFAHSGEPTLLFFAFPIEKKEASDHDWLMLSAIKEDIT